MSTYADFIERKSQGGSMSGFAPVWMPDFLFDFQQSRETVLTPFMGIGSEVYATVQSGRRAIGIELKPSYYRQAVKNVQAAKRAEVGMELFDAAE